MNGSNSTQPQQRSVAEWVHIIHNAGATDPSSPDFAHSRRVMRAARAGLQNAITTANEATDKEAQPGPVGAALVNFGQGASAGLAQTQLLRTALAGVPGGLGVLSLIGSTPEEYQDYLWKARSAQPGPSALGQGAGMVASGAAAAPLVAPLGMAGGGAALSGVQVGTQAGIEADSPVAGLVAGVPAAAFGAIGGKIISKIPIAQRVASGIMTRLEGRVPTSSAIDAAEAGIRQTLSKELAPSEVDQIVKEERLRLGREVVKKFLNPPPAPPTRPPGFDPVGGAVGDPGAIARPFPNSPSLLVPPPTVGASSLPPEGVGQFVGAVGDPTVLPKAGLPGGKASPSLRPSTARVGAQEAEIRSYLKSQHFTDEQVEQLVGDWKNGNLNAPSYQRTAAKLGQSPRPVPQATPSGVGNPPPNPALTEQYVKEANQRISDAAVRDATFTQAAEKTGALNPPTPPLAAGHTPAEVPPLTQYRMAVRKLEAEMGREISPEEQRTLMERFFGPARGVPGHEMWFGKQSFTRRP